MTDRTFHIIRGIVLLVVALGFIGWLFVRCLKRSDDPARLIFKWILTVPVVLGMLFWLGPFATSSQGGAFIGVPLVAACGIVLAIIWRHNLAELVAEPLTSLFDGGSEPPTPKPAYSTAQAKQKKGQYLEAVAEIRRQLERFPADVEGQMLLAQIQAEDLKDLQAAELTIERLCAQPGHAPQNIVFALYSLADWHLQVGCDREAAQRDLQKVVDLFPDSEFALGAAHRIAHLGGPEMTLGPHADKKFAVPEGVRNLGLLREQDHLRPTEASPEEVAAACVKHLERHPLDTEAREKLAVLYADHYGRLDMATGELEQMIGLPNQPGRLVVHWLNRLADLQIRHGAGYETVRATLQRIVDRDPKAAPAEIARNRIARLRLEMRSKESGQAVKLGSYEQNIGLKRGLPGG
jgi:tetratricopeptide (TPR) repeat protein